MTIHGDKICSIVQLQAFPVLLILAHSSKKCLDTPFVYKPPSPTHSPEYYEAYETLLHTLLKDKSCHDYQYGYPHSKSLCYHNNFHVNPTSIYSHNHVSSDSGYENGYPSYGNGYPNYGHGYPNYGHGYPTYSHTNYGEGYVSHYPSFGHSFGDYGNAKVLNSTDYAYNTNYAPNQVHNVKHKYKVVVVKNRGRKRSQKLQQGEYCYFLFNISLLQNFSETT